MSSRGSCSSFFPLGSYLRMAEGKVSLSHLQDLLDELRRVLQQQLSLGQLVERVDCQHRVAPHEAVPVLQASQDARRQRLLWENVKPTWVGGMQKWSGFAQAAAQPSCHSEHPRFLRVST